MALDHYSVCRPDTLKPMHSLEVTVGHKAIMETIDLQILGADGEPLAHIVRILGSEAGRAGLVDEPLVLGDENLIDGIRGT